MTVRLGDVADLAYELEPGLSHRALVDPGEPFVLRTLDASGDQIREGVPLDRIDRDRIFPVTGPVGIRGVSAGDVVGVEVASIEPDEFGHTWTRPGLGFGLDIDFHVRRLDARRPVIEWSSPVIEVPTRPHLGTVGVLPAELTEPRTLGLHGGNLDFVHCGVGSTTWMRAQVDGGGVFIGDVHMAMGDAEICGTGVETPAETELRVRTDAVWTPPAPVVTTADRAWVIGVGDEFDEALAAAVRAIVGRFAEVHELSPADAYLAVGLLLEVTVCQVVNPRRSVAVSLSSGADAVLRPQGTAP